MTRRDFLKAAALAAAAPAARAAMPGVADMRVGGAGVKAAMLGARQVWPHVYPCPHIVAFRRGSLAAKAFDPYTGEVFDVTLPAAPASGNLGACHVPAGPGNGYIFYLNAAQTVTAIDARELTFAATLDVYVAHNMLTFVFAGSDGRVYFPSRNWEVGAFGDGNLVSWDGSLGDRRSQSGTNTWGQLEDRFSGMWYIEQGPWSGTAMTLAVSPTSSLAEAVQTVTPLISSTVLWAFSKNFFFRRTAAGQITRWAKNPDGTLGAGVPNAVAGVNLGQASMAAVGDGTVYTMGEAQTAMFGKFVWGPGGTVSGYSVSPPNPVSYSFNSGLVRWPSGNIGLIGCDYYGRTISHTDPGWDVREDGPLPAPSAFVQIPLYGPSSSVILAGMNSGINLPRGVDFY